MADQVKNVFVSHVHEDDAGLGDLKDLLSKHGMEIRDGSINADKPNDAASPDYIKNQILAPRIQWAGTLIVYITPDTKNSEWVNWEIEYARKLGKNIVGVWGHGDAECDLPDALNDYAGAVVVGWHGPKIIEAINSGTGAWEKPDGTPAEPARSSLILARRVSVRLHSYIVRYDSGFAPNPFFGRCTLATCKPDIRRTARRDDWVVGTGSNNKKYRCGGHLVFAMRVSEIVKFEQYWSDARFEHKKPIFNAGRMYAPGDNIYRFSNGRWHQLRSFHSNADGSPNADHIARDTGTNRLLIASDFVYFGGEGPKIPKAFRKGRDICVSGIGRKVFEEENLIREFADWIRQLGATGYSGRPMDWIAGEW